MQLNAILTKLMLLTSNMKLHNFLLLKILMIFGILGLSLQVKVIPILAAVLARFSA